MAPVRFFVTVALGCIGAWVVRNLVHEGMPPTVFDLGTNPHGLRLIMDCNNSESVPFNMGDKGDLSVVVCTIERSEPQIRGLITFDNKSLSLPEGMDAKPLISIIGNLAHTSLEQGVANTIDIFRRAFGNGRLSHNSQ